MISTKNITFSYNKDQNFIMPDLFCQAGSTILVTGNSVIDALQFSTNKVNSESYSDPEIETLKTLVDPSKKLILVTGHRRENHGQGFINICEALKSIAIKNKDSEKSTGKESTGKEGCGEG